MAFLFLICHAFVVPCRGTCDKIVCLCKQSTATSKVMALHVLPERILMNGKPFKKFKLFVLVQWQVLGGHVPRSLTYALCL